MRWAFYNTFPRRVAWYHCCVTLTYCPSVLHSPVSQNLIKPTYLPLHFWLNALQNNAPDTALGVLWQKSSSELCATGRPSVCSPSLPYTWPVKDVHMAQRWHMHHTLTHDKSSVCTWPSADTSVTPLQCDKLSVWAWPSADTSVTPSQYDKNMDISHNPWSKLPMGRNESISSSPNFSTASDFISA